MSDTKRGLFTVLATKSVYRNPWINVREDKVINPSGKEGIFGVIEMKAGSTVLPLDDHFHTFLVREYKYGIERESIELMSGGLDGKENPLEGAKRELKEELGIEAARWDDLGMVDPFTTVVRSPNYMFLARDLSFGANTPEEWEKLEMIRVPFDEAVEKVMKGEITHSASCVCILKAARILQKE